MLNSLNSNYLNFPTVPIQSSTRKLNSKLEEKVSKLAKLKFADKFFFVGNEALIVFSFLVLLILHCSEQRNKLDKQRIYVIKND